MSTDEWVEMEDMPTPRYYLMCGLATTADGSQRIIVAGGSYIVTMGLNKVPTSLDTVEIFYVDERRWRKGELYYRVTWMVVEKSLC